MFQIKICGVTSAADARLAVEAGADAVGVNFYAGSPRCISVAEAEQVLAELPLTVARVGVFVNAPTAEIVATADRLRLDYIQLHGDEMPQQLSALAPRPVIKALRPRLEGALKWDVMELIVYLNMCTSRGARPAGVLLDAGPLDEAPLDVALTSQPGADSPSGTATEYGGTGRVTDWNTAIAYRKSMRVPPLILAGGLTPENVAEAISTVRPAAVDTASGVEAAPRRKDPARVRQFVAAARQAFSQLQ